MMAKSARCRLDQKCASDDVDMSGKGVEDRSTLLYVEMAGQINGRVRAWG